ncbi:MAG: hypothetical protein CVV41_20655 [Candidatus Riflebacteria bacterium HGW-Riflebacteria-1]|nr:MAG: hypothetical protein CVV41_20655 [Candidatus Riflebacteria bacterium HGW-Riflebacteria-1]
MIQNCFYKNVSQGAGRFPMRESFETGDFDAIPTTSTANLQLSIAVANGILPRARHKHYAKDHILKSSLAEDFYHLLNTTQVTT